MTCPGGIYIVFGTDWGCDKAGNDWDDSSGDIPRRRRSSKAFMV